MERRVKRSDNRAEALELYLANLAGRFGAEAVAVADDDGLLVSGVGLDLDWLAASTVAPIAANDAEVCELHHEGTTLRVAAIGGAPLPAPELNAALVRILDL